MATAIEIEQLTCCINGCTCQALYLVFTSRACDCDFPEVMKLCLGCRDAILDAVSPDNPQTRMMCTGCGTGQIIVTVCERIKTR